MSLTHDLTYFALSEFHRPDLVNERAARLLNDIRGVYGSPLTLTSDARTVAEETLLPGHAQPPESSLHVRGQAFDIRTRDLTNEQVWRLVKAVYTISVGQGGVELELSPTHLHVGFFFDGRLDKLLVADG